MLVVFLEVVVVWIVWVYIGGIGKDFVVVMCWLVVGYGWVDVVDD